MEGLMAESKKIHEGKAEYHDKQASSFSNGNGATDLLVQDV
jgi:hypothetical protein